MPLTNRVWLRFLFPVTPIVFHFFLCFPVHRCAFRCLPLFSASHCLPVCCVCCTHLLICTYAPMHLCTYVPMHLCTYAPSSASQCLPLFSIVIHWFPVLLQVRSGIMCQLSCVLCHVSDVRCQVSAVRYQVSGVRCQVSDVRLSPLKLR
jgi:hypothetical protein